jgi:hypothetical protein
MNTQSKMATQQPQLQVHHNPHSTAANAVPTPTPTLQDLDERARSMFL